MNRIIQRCALALDLARPGLRSPSAPFVRFQPGPEVSTGDTLEVLMKKGGRTWFRAICNGAGLPIREEGPTVRTIIPTQLASLFMAQFSRWCLDCGLNPFDCFELSSEL